MALWVVRCGGDSAFEQEAYEQKFVGIGWSIPVEEVRSRGW